MTPQPFDASSQAQGAPAYRRRASDRAPLDPNQLSGVRKAAILLMGMGEPFSTDVIRQLDATEIQRISTEITRLDTVAPDQIIEVFREFETLSANGRFFVRGGPDQARRLVEKAVGEEEAQRLLSASPVMQAADMNDPDASLSGIGPGELAGALREESPQTLALVLSNLPPEQAGSFMASLPPEIQPQVALRIALMERVSPEVFNQVVVAVRGKLKSSRPLLRSDGARALASILNTMEGEKAEVILSGVEAENQSAAASVRLLMFIFDDVVNLDPESTKVLIGRIDRKTLTLALKGTSENIKAHFTKTMSQRGAEMLVEDMDALGPVRIRDVHAAQKQIITKIRELEKEGVISSTSGGGDDYVV